MGTLGRTVLAGLAALVFLEPGRAEPRRPELSLPIACTPGKDCFIQNYVDVAGGPEAHDYACGAATYEGHNGVDIRLLSAAAAKSGVAVLAAADGVVSAKRDEMADAVPQRGGADMAALKGRECGNGVMIDHGQGWSTQYCHMLKDSVAVKPGDKVRRGERLGSVGYSGLAEFAHVHITVRHEGHVVDPFTGEETKGGGSCLKDAASAPGLWDAAARAKLGYRTAEIIGADIAGGTASWAQLEMDDRAMPRATREANELVVIARIIKLEAGERVRIRLAGPGALSIDTTTKPLERSKATYLAWGGSRRPAGVTRWPAGRYEGSVSVIDKDGVVRAERKVGLELN